MLVRTKMTPNPVTVTPQDPVANALGCTPSWTTGRRRKPPVRMHPWALATGSWGVTVTGFGVILVRTSMKASLVYCPTAAVRRGCRIFALLFPPKVLVLAWAKNIPSARRNLRGNQEVFFTPRPWTFPKKRKNDSDFCGSGKEGVRRTS